MDNVVQFVDPFPLDDFAKLWGALYDMINHSPLSRAEKLGVIEYVKAIILKDMLDERRQIQGD